MYNVVTTRKGKEKLGPDQPWFQAFQSYTQEALTINAVDEAGSYLQPDARIAIRKAI